MPASATPDPAAPVAFTYRETVVIITGLMLGMFLSALDQTIVATALPRISADLHGVEHLSWVVSAYLLTSTAATPIYGKLSDLYGRKAMLQIAISVFLVASVLCGFAGSMAQLILFRGLQGLGGGGLIAMAHATIADVISPRERGRYQAYIAAVFAVASIVGPVLGGIFAEHLTWRWVFWINLPIGIGALVLSELTLKRLAIKRIRHRIDYLGAVLIVSAVCCIMLLTTMGGNEVPWRSPVIAGLAFGALALFACCVVQERHAREPVLPPRLFGCATFVIASTANLLTAIGMLGGIVFMPLFLQLVYGMSPQDSGLMLIPLTGTTVIAAITAGRLVAATGRYKIFPILGTMITGTGALLLSLVSPALPLWATAAAMAACGSGIGLINPVLMVAVQNAVEPRDLGTATSSISFFRSMGGAFGVALFGAVLIARLGSLVGAIPGHEAIGTDPALALLHAGPTAQALAPAAIRPAVTAAMLAAFHDLFRLAAGVALLTFLIMLRLEEMPLKTVAGRVAAERAGASAAASLGD